jgi:hypothetical protein
MSLSECVVLSGEWPRVAPGPSPLAWRVQCLASVLERVLDLL